MILLIDPPNQVPDQSDLKINPIFTKDAKVAPEFNVNFYKLKV